MDYSIPPIGELFLSAFGLKVGGVYKPNISTGNPDNPTGFYQGLTVVEDEDDTNMISALGTKILYPLEFQSGVYREYNPMGEIVKKTMGNFRLPIASIVSFRRDKDIAVTPVNGGYGTAKEFYGFDDWQITINGFLIKDASQPQGFYNPLKQEKELINWDNLACSIPIHGKPFDAYKISNITIKGISFEPMRGKPNIRAFTINAISDNPIKLNIKSSLSPNI